MSDFKYSPQAQLAIEAAQREAAAKGHMMVSTGHLLLGIFHTSNVPDEDFGPAILRKYNVSRERVERLVLERLGAQPPIKPPLPLARETQEAIDRAEAVREKLDDEYIRTEYLLIGISSHPLNLAAHIMNWQLDRPTVQAEIFLRRNRPVA